MRSITFVKPMHGASKRTAMTWYWVETKNLKNLPRFIGFDFEDKISLVRVKRF